MPVPRFLRHSRGLNVEMPPVVTRWVLRMLFSLGAHTEFVTRHGFNNDRIARQLGLAHWVDPEDREFNPKLIRTELRRLHQASELSQRAPAMPACLVGNVDRLLF